jgi:thiol:disulfide interchange protein
MLGVAFFSWAFITSLGATRPMRLVQIILLAAALVSAASAGLAGARRPSSRRTWLTRQLGRATRRWRRRKVNR